MAPGIFLDSAAPATATGSTPYFSKSPAQLSQVIHHSLITEEFDALRFHAAASLQLVSPLIPGGTPLLDNRIISSPYNDSDHLLALDTLSLQDKILALALTSMRPILEDYATADYELSFNWTEIFRTARALASSVNHPWTKQEFYVVIFRSQLKDGCDKQLLHDLDKHSHREATVSGGLLKYWFGSCNADRRNLATCKCYHSGLSEILHVTFTFSLVALPDLYVSSFTHLRFSLIY
jgi:hypothetical protein